MVFVRTFGISLFSTILLIILSSLCFLFTSNTAAIPSGESLSWDEFLSDYTDKDGDGEKDTFLSFDALDKITIDDQVVRLLNYDNGSEEFSEIILESNPEPLIYGNTLGASINQGDRILVEISVINGEETDGDKSETYEVNSVWYFEEEDNGKENGDTWGYDLVQNMPCFGWIIMAVSIIMVCLIIYVVFVRPKNKKNELKSGKTGKRKNSK